MTNQGSFDALGVVVTDSWPELYDLDTVPGNCLRTSTSVVCNFALLPARASVSIMLPYRVSSAAQGGTFVTNCASVSAAGEASDINHLDSSDCDTNLISVICVEYNGVCRSSGDCCEPLECLRHASSCGGKLGEGFKCARNGRSRK